MRASVILIAALAVPLLSCDQLTSLLGLESQWKVADANGTEGAFHFVTNAFDIHIGYPEHIRVERIETRTIKKPGGATEEQKRVKKVRVIMARCESRSICDAIPHADDTREVVVTGKIMGDTMLYVTAVVDETDEMKDAIKIRVQP